MNEYAQLARERHAAARPIQHALIEDPGGFFEQIGRELDDQVRATRGELLGPRASRESREDFQRRGQQCQATAVELVLGEHFLFQPENPNDEDEDFSDEELADDPGLAQHLAELAMIDHAIAEFYRPDEP
jgi:hypothetical protein